MTDLAELFDRDPLSLTDQDLQKIIETLRGQRQNWSMGAKSAGKMPKGKTQTKKEVVDTASILKDLGL